MRFQIQTYFFLKALLSYHFVIASTLSDHYHWCFSIFAVACLWAAGIALELCFFLLLWFLLLEGLLPTVHQLLSRCVISCGNSSTLGRTATPLLPRSLVSECIFHLIHFETCEFLCIVVKRPNHEIVCVFNRMSVWFSKNIFILYSPLYKRFLHTDKTVIILWTLWRIVVTLRWIHDSSQCDFQKHDWNTTIKKWALNTVLIFYSIRIYKVQLINISLLVKAFII